MTTEETPAKKPRTRKTAAPTIAKAADPESKPEFAPSLTPTGRLDHSNCGHPRTPAGRQSCRAVTKHEAGAAE